MKFITPNVQIRCARWRKDPSLEVYEDGKTYNPWKLGDFVPVVAISVVEVDAGKDAHPMADVLLCDILGGMHDPYLAQIPDAPHASLGVNDFDTQRPVRIEWFDPEIGEWRPLP